MKPLTPKKRAAIYRDDAEYAFQHGDKPFHADKYKPRQLPELALFEYNYSEMLSDNYNNLLSLAYLFAAEIALDSKVTTKY